MKRLEVVVAGALLLAGCAVTMSDREVRTQTEAMLARDFAKGDRTIATRVATQDEVQELCSGTGEVSKDVAARIEASQQATLKYPASGKLMGDWRAGEKIAQDGWGMRFTDTGQPNRMNGGACYNCHQLAAQELSFGTLGPSLQGFGKLRGFTPEMQKYAYGKIYNAQAFTACSSMPRFGHNGVLTEKQIQDLVALLMDPESSVNK
jgi:sulfur-oxidizing protein SoxX